MAGLSYSAHLSQKNSAINSKAKLSGVAKHNLRKYRSLEYDKENIVILWGTDKLVQDVKKVYKEQFDEAVREYNKKQTRDDRKIDDYFEKTAKSNKDMAVELIFQIGDKEFWDKNPDKRRRMDVAFKEMLDMLQKEAPNLVVANAVIHYDEASPHMHVVAVPVADGFKKGMSRQVSKRKVCTKEFLEKVLQGRIREYAEGRSFTWIGEFLKEKEKGRNNDLKVAEYKTLAETKKANQLARENAESKQELKETMIKQIAAEKELADMYEELKIVENVADLGKNVKKLETMVRKGPDNPKGIMSAKNYREKIVIPFIDKMYDAFKNVVKFAKGCFAQLKELTEKYNEQLEVNEMLRKQNSRLRESIDEQEKEIDGLYDDRKKLGYFKKFLKKEDYNKVVEMLEEPQYYLKVFLTDGDIPIDNSASERSIRTFCVGKKNWMFHNTANGAWASALIYSISETVKLNGLRPYYYFRYILTELPKLCDEQGNLDPADLEHLMPWSPELPEECRKPRR